MSKAQLETLYSKIGPNHPNLQYNGPFLHIQQTGLGGFNEWSVLTYNLQLIAKYIKENKELRNKYEELLQVYNGKQPQPQVSGVGGASSGEQNLTTVISMMLQRIEELEKKFSNNKNPLNIYTGSWTGYGKLP